MEINKAWDWKQVKEQRWYQPSEDSYFLLHRWSDLGYKKFLDLGCGRGRHALLFAHHNFEVSAVDLSEFAIDELQKNTKKLGLSLKCNVSDMTELPYEDGEFDCLMAYHVISHSDTIGVNKAIKEIKRVVKRDGEVFITFGCKDTLKLMTRDFHHIEPNVIIKEDGHEKGIPHFYIDEISLKQLLIDFEIISTRKIQNIDLPGSKKYGWHYFVHAKVTKQ